MIFLPIACNIMQIFVEGYRDFEVPTNIFYNVIRQMVVTTRPNRMLIRPRNYRESFITLAIRS